MTASPEIFKATEFLMGYEISVPGARTGALLFIWSWAHRWLFR
jgi:hypothetical protein